MSYTYRIDPTPVQNWNDGQMPALTWVITWTDGNGNERQERIVRENVRQVVAFCEQKALAFPRLELHVEDMREASRDARNQAELLDAVRTREAARVSRDDPPDGGAR